jgi:uncharacterized protein YqjF (DUF2071 family)
MPKRFLTANWRHLCLLTFTCPAELLRPHCPPGTDLEFVSGEPHVSLVAFDFLQTRVLGIGWPGFRNFPEINLRFYVTDGDRRGVVFIREYVPSPFVAWLARRLYNEPYLAAPMTSEVTCEPNDITTTHQLHRGGANNTLRVVAAPTAHLPAADTLEHHFKEHQWGFGTTRSGKPVVYEVRHPHWEVFPVKSFDLDWDWDTVYGPEWAFLAFQEPVSVILAAGSGVEVFWRG